MGKKTRAQLVHAESVCTGETNKVKLFFFLNYFIIECCFLLSFSNKRIKMYSNPYVTAKGQSYSLILNRCTVRTAFSIRIRIRIPY